MNSHGPTASTVAGLAAAHAVTSIMLRLAAQSRIAVAPQAAMAVAILSMIGSPVAKQTLPGEERQRQYAGGPALCEKPRLGNAKPCRVAGSAAIISIGLK